MAHDCVRCKANRTTASARTLAGRRPRWHRLDGRNGVGSLHRPWRRLPERHGAIVRGTLLKIPLTESNYYRGSAVGPVRRPGPAEARTASQFRKHTCSPAITFTDASGIDSPMHQLPIDTTHSSTSAEVVCSLRHTLMHAETLAYGYLCRTNAIRNVRRVSTVRASNRVDGYGWSLLYCLLW